MPDEPVKGIEPVRLASRKVDVCSIGWIASESLTYEEWESLGVMYRFWAGCIQWVLGDWLNWGESQFGEKYAQAVEETELDAQTLRNYSYICHKVPRENRDPRLSFSHHAEVAPLSHDDQKSLLDQAHDNGWTVRLLRQQVTNLRVERGLMAPPVKDAADYAEIFERHNLPTPMLNGDRSLVPVAKRLEEMEKHQDTLADRMRQAATLTKEVRDCIASRLMNEEETLACEGMPDGVPLWLVTRLDAALALMGEVDG